MRHQASFSELREAIRQGQVKIAQGLKTGQMRSDRTRQGTETVSGPSDQMPQSASSLKNQETVSARQVSPLPTPSVAVPKKPFVPAYARGRLTGLETTVKKKKVDIASVISKIKSSLKGIATGTGQIFNHLGAHTIAIFRAASLVCAMALVVLAVYWIGKGLFYGSSDRSVSPKKGYPSVAHHQTVSATEPPRTTIPERPAPALPPAAPMEVAPKSLAPAPAATRAAPSRPAPASLPSSANGGTQLTVPATPVPAKTGDNVIVIQGIATSREAELKPVQEFFARNGIATEIIRRNNYSLLATAQRFENPDRPGTDGYEMKQKIRQLGKQYVTQTGDTKFGVEPFKDAYGMLKPKN